MKIYETFVAGDVELKDGEEQLLEIRDIETYEERLVKAVISSSPEKLEGADVLRLRGALGQMIAENWAIKIIQELKGSGEGAES